MKLAGYTNTQWIIRISLLAAIGVVMYLGVRRMGPKETGTDQLIPVGVYQSETTDPALILYEETTPPINTGFSWCRSIAVDGEDRIYVTSGKALRAFSPTGEQLPLAIEVQHELTAVTVGADGIIYLGAGDHIEVYDAQGKLVKQWPNEGPNAVLTSIGLTDDRVFAADFGNRTVHYYDRNGTKIETFGEFVVPSFYFDVAISEEGNVLVANTGEHRVETYSPEGNLISWWGEFSNDDIKKFCGCCNPINFAMLPNREGFVTCEKGYARVKVYDLEGNFKGVVAGPELFSHQVNLSAVPDYCFSHLGLDVAVDSTGRILVLDPSKAHVRVFSRKSNAGLIGSVES